MKRSILIYLALFIGISFPAFSQEVEKTLYCFNHGPYLQGLTSENVHVYFTTSQKGFSWVELKPAGEENYTRCVTTDNGLIEANNTKNAINLKNLRPASEYEYRLVSVPILQFKLSQSVYGDTIRTPWYSFKTLNPKSKSHSFITTSDIHDDAKKYARLLDCLPADSVDMVFLLGDILSHFSKIDQPYTSFIDVSVEKFATCAPFVLVRGNHDTRGQYARTYNQYIYRADNRFYGTYQLGDTFIILLDTGEDKPDSHHDYSGITAFDDYRREQAEWLEQVIKSKNFKKAKKRLVLAHIPPLPRGESTRASRHAADVLYREYLPILNKAKIDLMICGHTHRFMLLEPGSETNYKFPILVNDNRSASLVRIDSNGIFVKTINENCEISLERYF